MEKVKSKKRIRKGKKKEKGAEHEVKKEEGEMTLKREGENLVHSAYCNNNNIIIKLYFRPQPIDNNIQI